MNQLRRILITVILLPALAHWEITTCAQERSTKQNVGSAFSSRGSDSGGQQNNQANAGGEETEEPEEPSPFSRYGYAYSLGQTETGSTGLFSIFDAFTLRKKEFRAGVFATRFNRSPGDLQITQFPLQFSVGVLDHLELFFGTDIHQRVRAGNPSELSGSLLRNSFPPGSFNLVSVLDGNSGGFFSLPGLSVSGALVGGILPGLPRGQSRQVLDPILSRQKGAFLQPSYYNELPFVAQGGSSYGDTIIGAKFRFINFTPGATFNQMSVLGYVKFPASGTNSLLSGVNNPLFAGTSSGTTDFAIYFLNSLYIPKPGSGKSSSNNPQTQGSAQPDAAKTEIIDTINIHYNMGYIRNGDPKINGIRIVDRKDNFVTGIGMDSMLNRRVQAIGELSYTRLVGGGTPNLAGNNPIDVTAGVRVFPIGMPKDVSVCDIKKVGSKLFLSVGAGYKYSFNLSSLSGAVGNHHGFVFSLTLGRSNNEPKVDVCSTQPVGSCEESERELPLLIQSLTIDKTSVRTGQEIKLTAQVKNRFKAGLQYKWEFPNGEVKTTKTPEITFTISNLRARQGYLIKLTASYKVKDQQCPNKTREVSFDVLNSPPTLELSPQSVGPVSANTPQDITLRATATDPDNDPVSLSWRTPPEIVLRGSEGDPVRSFSTSGLRAGQRYTVTVIASDGQEAVEKQAEIKVNNPPTVSLQVSPEVTDNKPVSRGVPITLTARGSDADGDRLTYNWSLSANSFEGTPLSPPSLEGDSGNPVRTLRSQDLPAGVYTARVTASDGIDTSPAAEVTFRIEEETLGASIYFDFDKYRLSDRSKTAASARKTLIEQARWLLDDANRLIIIRVEGNADRRGTVKYNLRLGCRRACAAKQFLVHQGVDEDRVRIIVSYGKSKASRNPSSYARDRRVDLVYIRGNRNAPRVEGETCECQTRY